MTNQTSRVLTLLQEATINAEELRNYWCALMPTAPVPDLHQFIRWSRLHHADLGCLIDGIDGAARKYASVSGAMDLDYLTRYASKTANSKKNQKAA